MRFTFSQLRQNRDIVRLAHEWEKRIAAIVRAMATETANNVLLEVKMRAPDGIPGYPEMLVALSFDAPSGMAVAGVVPEIELSHRLTTADVKRAVVYVIPTLVKATGRALSPAAALLMRHNPWTMDTLPYEPTKREARLVSRFVSEKEVKAVEAARNAEIDKVKEELSKIIGQLRPHGKVALDRRVERDIAFEVLRNEFGVPPIMGRAHWRPAIRVAQRDSLRMMESMAGWFDDPRNSEWKKVKNLSPGSGKLISAAIAFQDVLIGAAPLDEG